MSFLDIGFDGLLINQEEEINFRAWRRLQNNWEFTASIFEEAIVSKNARTVQLTAEIAKIILFFPEQSKPSWWSDQLKKERFQKLASEVQTKSEALKKDPSEKMCALFSAIKLEDEARSTSVSDTLFGPLLEQFARNKDWKNLKIQLTRINEEIETAHCWNHIKFRSVIEDIVLKNMDAFFTEESASDFELCAKLKWEKCLSALAEKYCMVQQPEVLQSILTHFDIYLVKQLCRITPLAPIKSADNFIRCLQWFYNKDGRYWEYQDKMEIVHTLIYRLCCSKLSWFHSAKHRCTLCSIAIQANDDWSASALSEFSLTTEERVLPAVLNVVKEAAKKGLKDVCKRLITHGANILSDHRDSEEAFTSVFELFDKDIITIIPEADCVRAVINRKNSLYILIILLNECTKRTTMPTWLQEKDFQQALLQRIKIDNINFQSHFCSRGSKTAFTVLCELKLKEHVFALVSSYTLDRGWESLEKAFGTDTLKLALEQCSLSDSTAYDLMLSLFQNKKNELGKMLLLKIIESPPEKQPDWWKNNNKELLKYVPLTALLELVSHLRKNRKETLANTFVDIAFTFHEDHFKFGFLSEKIPAKEDRSMRIDQSLLLLYDEYEQTKGDARREALEVFASRVINCTPYIGTPIANSSALRDFYETIDNATCNTIKKLVTDMKKLKTDLQELQRTHQSTQTQEAKINEQLNTINLFLETYIDAAPMCGGAYLSHAIQQYSLVVLGKSTDLKSTVQSLAGVLRHQILELLISYIRTEARSGQMVAENQTSHLYDLFLRKKGKKYGIPGHTMVDFDDACVAARHHEEVDLIDKAFLQYYKPSVLLDFMQKSFAEEPQKGQFITKLIKDTHKEWGELYVPELIKEIRKALDSTTVTSLSSTLSTEAKQIILKYLSSYSILLDDEAKDLQSLATLEQALIKHTQLYLALNVEGKTFTKEAMLQLLVEFQCLC